MIALGFMIAAVTVYLSIQIGKMFLGIAEYPND